MKIGDIILAYRNEKKISQRQFAKICSLSNGYIAMLERGGVNPKTNQPITPTLQALSKIARGMKISLYELLEQVNEFVIDCNDCEDTSFLSTIEQQIIVNFRQLDDIGRKKLLDFSGLYHQVV